MEKNSKVTVWGVGHTHIDVAWLWRLRHTREKAMRSFSTVLRLMEEFDEYVFLQSQPQLYQFIKEDSPELYGKIKQRVSDSRWEADGAMWLEADCNVTSGESLVRQLLEGITFFQEEFGVRCHTLWLPDVFGYSWALPQLLRQCGIDTFMTTKISWNKYNTMPNDLFRWKGIDGTEILTYFINTPEIGHPLTSRFATYNGMLSPRSVLGSWEKFKNKDITQNTLISYGFGDGGGGPNRNMLKMRRAMARLPGLPNVKAASSREFFEKIHADADKAGEKVPVWDGELYLEFHRGTYTSQAQNKQKNRRLEFSLCQAEWISSLSYVLWNTYEESALDEAWKIVLRNQFHDIIPGSSIHEVYADSQRNPRAQELLRACQAGLEKSKLPPTTAIPCIISPALPGRTWPGFPRSRKAGLWSVGRLTAVRGWEGYRVRVPMRPLSCRTIRFIPGEVSEKPSGMVVDVEERVVTTPFYRLKWNPDGSIGEIYDRRCARQLLAGDSGANRLMVYEDKPLEYDAWELEPFYPQKGGPGGAGQSEVLECSALRVVVRFDYRYHHSQIIQDMTLYANSPRIDFATRVDWHESTGC
ncbi:MAG: alpha-mannosidase [Oscillospiraceae bacterium]